MFIFYFFKQFIFVSAYFIFYFNLYFKIILNEKQTIDIQIKIQQSKTTIQRRIEKQTMNNEIQREQRDTFQDLKKEFVFMTNHTNSNE